MIIGILIGIILSIVSYFCYEEIIKINYNLKKENKEDAGNFSKK